MKQSFLRIVLLFALSLAAASPAFSEEISYWDSFKEEAARRYRITADYWGRHFEEELHPKLIELYSKYYEAYGRQAGENFWISYDAVAPEVERIRRETISYYDEHHPEMMRFLGDIPAFVKKPYESFIIAIWQRMSSVDPKEFERLSKEKRRSVEMAMAAGNALRNPNHGPEHQRLNSLLDQIKYRSFDYGMQDCYEVVYFDYDIKNAFNIGCHIFFSNRLYEFIGDDDDQLRAILAHELSHGDRGHGLKTLFQMGSAGAAHGFHFGMQELVWLATGDQMPLLETVKSDGHAKEVMKRFASNTPRIELDADRTGAQILNAAGFSAKPLIQVLERLHREMKYLDCKKDALKGGTGRDYPTFCERKAAIERVMKF